MIIIKMIFIAQSGNEIFDMIQCQTIILNNNLFHL